ncbi:ParA family protein [Pseudomonas aeruginosa]|nr:ParA family protein [Pseudomonas aeruginosa]MCS9764122.1 ParA family protein [Pseudomonas aeruginosa]MCS9820299.1 ParA family protein [Pseudomonas aeruginosa]MCT0240880.1 ParA family protein [Pseudomonas aeruginosa]MCT0528332.1 ParA family protein [Pseudomonas aeruginosa]
MGLPLNAPFPKKFQPVFSYCPVIVSTNYKGGVGKTLSSRVLAQGIADPVFAWFAQTKPVLILDFDPQGNSSLRWDLLQPDPNDEFGSLIPIPHPELMDESPNYSSVCDLWQVVLEKARDGAEFTGEMITPVPYQTSNPMIHVLPADERLMRQAQQLNDKYAPFLGSMLLNWLRSPEVAAKYSAVIIDTAPSKSHLIDAALTAATHVYIPFVPEPQSAEGVLSIIAYVSRFAAQRQAHDPLNLIGLLPNLVEKKTRLHRAYLKALETQVVGQKYMMPVKLERRIAYAETDSANTSPTAVTDLVDSTIATEAKRFIRYVLERVCETSATNFPRAA